MKQIGSVADGCGQTCLGLSHIDFATTLLQSETQTLAATKLVRSCLISALQQSYCSLRLRLTDNPCLLVDHRALCAAYSNAFMPQQRQLCFKQHLQTFSSTQLHTKASAYKCICVQQRLRTSASAFSSICLQQHLCSTASAFNSTCVQHPTASVFNIQQHCAGWQGAGPACVTHYDVLTPLGCRLRRLPLGSLKSVNFSFSFLSDILRHQQRHIEAAKPFALCRLARSWTFLCILGMPAVQQCCTALVLTGPPALWSRWTRQEPTTELCGRCTSPSLMSRCT